MSYTRDPLDRFMASVLVVGLAVFIFGVLIPGLFALLPDPLVGVTGTMLAAFVAWLLRD